MKVGHILLIAIVLIIAVIGVAMFTTSQNNIVEEQPNIVEENVVDKNQNMVSASEALNIATATDLTSFVEKVYEGVEVYPSIATMELDLTDLETLEYETGLVSADKIDTVVVSQPMISAQAYSMILVKVKDEADADSIAKEMSEKVNPNKWICVSAEKIYATSSGNVAFLIMTNADMAEDVYENFKTKAGKIGPEYSKDNAIGEMPMDEDMLIPAA